MLPFLVIAGASGIVFAAIALAKRHERERAESLRAAAARLGWGYRDKVQFDAIPKLDRFELFTQGHGRTLTNLLTSPDGDPRFVLFDYSYTTGGGKSQTTHRQTVLYAVSDMLTLPTFSIRPQGFFHSIAKAFGYQDIDLERRPVFSEMYLLRGDDEMGVRAAFVDAVAEFFERHEGMCAAGVGRELLYWKPGRRVNGDELDAFVKEGSELASRFAAGG